MPEYAIQHLIAPLVAPGNVIRSRDPDLFKAIQDRADEIDQALWPLSRRLRIDRDLGIAISATIPESELDEISDRHGYFPISPVSQYARLSYHESLVAMHMRRGFEGISDDTSPGWVTAERIYDALCGFLPDGLEHDEVGRNSRMLTILSKLETYRLIESREVNKIREFRATAYICIAITADDMDRFSRAAEAYADEVEQAAAQARDASADPQGDGASGDLFSGGKV